MRQHVKYPHTLLGGVWWSYNGFHGGIRFILVYLSSKCGVCSKWTFGLAHATFFSPLSSFISKLTMQKIKVAFHFNYFFIFGEEIVKVKGYFYFLHG
jgi:hypothetical protein